MNRAEPHLLSLPEELLLQLLQDLHIKDLLNIRSTHPIFVRLIDSNPLLWANTSFQNAWPSPHNIRHFNKASDHGNVEALVKLGIAYLYNEGLPTDFQGNNVTHYGEQAAALFCKVERLLSKVIPFTWLFIRPPWSPSGECCKESVFTNMKKYILVHDEPNVTLCVAKTLKRFDNEYYHKEALEYLREAASGGSSHAAYLLWQELFSEKLSDPASELSAIRELREVVALSDPDAIIELCKLYAKKKYGGLCEKQAASFVRNFIKSSRATYLEDIYRRSELTHSMRYILIDWLVEVARMKNFGTTTLHVAISVVDRFLKFHPMSRVQFQLLGVAAMVLCSRFLDRDIITIREAAWLTDNAYKYEDVVRMMGEIIATLKGDIRVWCSYDYVQLIGLLAENDRKTESLAEYICELSLLQSEVSSLPQGQIAACAVLLARLTLKKEFPWPQQMLHFTGYSIPQLAGSTMLIHEKCFLQGGVRDHRSVVLEAVKERYSDRAFERASDIEIMSAEELQRLLGMHYNTSSILDTSSDIINEKDLIMSPSRNKGGHAKRPSQMSEEREKAATPTLESMENSFEALLNDSNLSECDGDMEVFPREDSDANSPPMAVPLPVSFVNQSGSQWRLSAEPGLSPSSKRKLSISPPTIRINLPSLGFNNTSPANARSACFLTQARFRTLHHGDSSNRAVVSDLNSSSSTSNMKIYTDESDSIGGKDGNTRTQFQCNTRNFPMSERDRTDSTKSPFVSKRGAFCNISNVDRAKQATPVQPRKRKTSGQLGNECKTHVISQ